MGRTSNFTDAQKADIFVRDHATCGYTGINLWLLDHGADPYYQVDWADHLVPVSKGGTSTLDNGICAAWSANYDKLDKMGGPPCKYKAGKPTSEFEDCDVISDELAAQFKRFARLHASDWYLNRALFRLWLGIVYLSEEACKRSRTDAYYARASLKAIVKWRTQTKKHQLASIEARGLAPEAPTVDQSVMLMIRDADSVEDIKAMMLRLLPFYMARLEPEPRP